MIQATLPFRSPNYSWKVNAQAQALLRYEIITYPEKDHEPVELPLTFLLLPFEENPIEAVYFDHHELRWDWDLEKQHSARFALFIQAPEVEEFQKLAPGKDLSEMQWTLDRRYCDEWTRNEGSHQSLHRKRRHVFIKTKIGVCSNLGELRWSQNPLSLQLSLATSPGQEALVKTVSISQDFLNKIWFNQIYAQWN